MSETICEELIIAVNSEFAKVKIYTKVRQPAINIMYVTQKKKTKNNNKQNKTLKLKLKNKQEKNSPFAYLIFGGVR